MSGWISLLKLLFGLALGYGLLLLAVYLLQPRLLYFPRALLDTDPTPAELGLAYEDVWLETADGLRLHGWYLAAGDARRVALFFHGNAGNIADRLQTLALLRRLGLAVLIIDYRGYGHSQGRPDEAGTYADADAAWAYLTRQRGWAPRQIVVWGRSLGGAVAARLAARHRPAALIMESSFSALPDLAAEVYPWLPARRLSRFRYDNLASLARVRAPVLLLHSRDDEVIPYHHALSLQAAAPAGTDLVSLSGPHNGGFLLDAVAYETALRRFLARLDETNPA